MVRQLQEHERRLLKKVDFMRWKNDSTMREIQVMRRYHIQNREDYAKCAAGMRRGHCLCVQRMGAHVCV
jgi:uncharacterized protein YqgQ